MQNLQYTAFENEEESLIDPQINSKPEPEPIYQNSTSLHWSGFPSSHVLENSVQSLSRCPSLMSTGTLSSRNSSTRSNRSLGSSVWRLDRYINEETYSASAIANSEYGATQNTPFTAQVVGLCPWKHCERHLRGFTKAGDLERHLLVHCERILICDFCESSKRGHVAFREGSDRVSRFLTHLVEIHDASDTGGPKEPPTHPVHKARGRWFRNGPRAKCPVCKERHTPGSLYKHLPSCVGDEVKRIVELSGRIHRVSNDPPRDPDLSINATEDERIFVSQLEGQLHRKRSPIFGTQDESCEQSKPIYPGCGDIAELTASSSRLSLVSSRATTSSEEETDCSEDVESRESSPHISQVPLRMAPAKRRLVDAIMQEFQHVFSASLRSHTTNGSDSNSNGSTAGSSTATPTYPDTSSIPRKRGLSGGGSTPPDDGDDSHKRPRPDSVPKGKQPISELRFACPYYKRNPGRHQTFTSCRDPGFTTVARLK
jgi:hypothetical protein